MSCKETKTFEGDLSKKRRRYKDKLPQGQKYPLLESQPVLIRHSPFTSVSSVTRDGVCLTEVRGTGVLI